MDADVIVVGGGLSGLWTALGLERAGLRVVLLEGRDRWGGRILAADATTARDYDMGPAWVWPTYQPRITALVESLDLSLFPQATHGRLVVEDAAGHTQVLPNTWASAPPSMRLHGGFARLIERLAGQLSATTGQRGITVTRLSAQAAGGVLVTGSGTGCEILCAAPRVVLAVPPRLVAGLYFDPPLPHPTRALLPSIPTWMAGYAKALALYPEPFWRVAGYSGQAFSHAGPLGEIHDASVGPGEGALFGFFAGFRAHRAADADTLISQVCAQLGRLFGPRAALPTRVLVQDWATEPLTATVADAAPLSEHPPYQPLDIREGLWADRLIFAGTEVAFEHGGYLEGAVEAAERAIAQVLGGLPGAAGGRGTSPAGGR
ncbi:MAG: flavin monoamine oxidase family protein [Acidiferrobacter sp.]